MQRLNFEVMYSVKRVCKVGRLYPSLVRRHQTLSTAESRDLPLKYIESHRVEQSSHIPESTFRHPHLPRDVDDKRLLQLYEHHIPTNYFQKMILSVGAATAALLDPKRADMVAVLGETTGHFALSRLFDDMVRDPEGQEILRDKPRIHSSIINLDELAHLPNGTFGHAYVKFLNDNQVTPDSRLPVQYVDDADMAYVLQRYREVHDLFHTVLGMPTNMLGEVTVKWIEGMQTQLPMCIGGAIYGPLRFRPKQRQLYLSTYLPWAIRVAKAAKPLMHVYFEKRWKQSLVDLRRELNIEDPPI
ncbi:Ubiquinone biosynthesis protein [Halocaridina rubra]|uniref:Ubiquinone biosynthesis protein COQ4 homolog, mitochondrial n=1 Tax=Halocaridina rubra TaxID=373956 RepID=A0AAN8XL51_HALRR